MTRDGFTMATMRLGGLIAIMAFLGLAAGCSGQAPVVTSPATTCAVDHVIDGDTIAVICDPAHIRFLLINTPEIAHGAQAAQCGGSEAKAYVESRLPKGAPVRLERGKRDKDVYGRSLRYVWLGDELLDETLVRLGYAERYRDAEDHTYEARIIAAEKLAKAEGVGIWRPGCR